MRVVCVEPTNFQAKVGSSEIKRVNILKSQNEKNQYLYNQILDLSREYNIPAKFQIDGIELPNVSQKIITELNKLKIKFNSK